MKNFKVYNERGWYTVFFSLFILPIILLLGSVSLDLANMIMLKRRLQSDLDYATLQAIKFLPDKELATRSIKNYVNLRNDYRASLNISYEGDTLLANAKKGFNFALGDAFLGKKNNFEISVNSHANSYPREVLLYFDSGNNVAPNVNSGEPLGDSQHYPASTFFVEYYRDNMIASERELRLITQQCFNPIFSSIKNASIKLVDYFSNFSHVSIGISFYPGIISETEFARPPIFYSEKIASTDRYVLRKNFGYSYVSSTLCAAASENERNTSSYFFPKESTDKRKPDYRVDKSTYEFISGYDTFLLPEEYIWMIPANENRGSDFSAVLERAYHDMFSSKFRDEHGNLKTKVRKVLVFISNTLPQINNVYFPNQTVKSKLISSIDKFHEVVNEFGTNISIYYILINPEQNFVSSSKSNISKFSAFLASKELRSDTKISFKLLVSDSSMGAVNEIITILSMANKKSIIKA